MLEYNPCPLFHGNLIYKPMQSCGTDWWSNVADWCVCVACRNCHSRLTVWNEQSAKDLDVRTWRSIIWENKYLVISAVNAGKIFFKLKVSDLLRLVQRLCFPFSPRIVNTVLCFRHLPLLLLACGVVLV